MIEDVLEQIAEDYFLCKPGSFTKTNVKYRPDSTIKGYDSKYDSVHSDIDVLVMSTTIKNEIDIINCKSWQSGFNINEFNKKIVYAIDSQPIKQPGKRGYWTNFRELCISKWTEAFIKKIKSELNIDNDSEIKINYTILCTILTKRSQNTCIKISQDKITKHFKKVNKSIVIDFKIITIDEYIKVIVKKILNKETPAVENTHLSRTFQLLYASGHSILNRNKYSVGKLKNLECGNYICNNFVFSCTQSSYSCPEHFIETLEVYCSYKCYKNMNKPRCSICGKLLKKN